MFESLGDRLQNALHKIKGYGKITEDNISDMMREIRLALLEADVNYQVVKEFTNTVKEKALGEEVQKSIKPGDLFVKIVKDELTELLGGESAPLNMSCLLYTSSIVRPVINLTADTQTSSGDGTKENPFVVE